MKRHNGNPARALVVLCLVAVPVAAAVWFVYRVTERTIAAVDRRFGDWFWLTLALILAAAVALVAIGGAVALVRRWNRHVRAKDGLFPVLETRGGFVNVNEPGAQTLAALAGAAHRVSAPTAARVIDAHYSNMGGPAEALKPALPAPDGEAFPALAPVYGWATPRELALPVGVDGRGQPVALALRNLGNVLAAGLPGSGKSELLASMTAGLLRQDATGERIRLAVIDTKLVSFGNMPELAALYARPALEIDEAGRLVYQLLMEVRRRFQALHATRARSLEEFETRTGERMPYLVAMVDEMADLTQDTDRQRAAAFVAAATEIGRKGRAAGVSLVMATQRPSADVIPSSLRNLAGAAVAFQVSKADDSRLILGYPGAELLPATPGRCLARHHGMMTLQAYYAGLEGGQFDAFVDGLPRGEPATVVDGEVIAAEGWPVRAGRESVGIPHGTAGAGGPGAGIPVFGTDQKDGYSPDQVAHIRRLYADLGSIKAVQRALYGQEGGHWFYELRKVIQDE